ncbi:MAG TPA: class I SAM-dependent methyltransferase, partial [Niabella sp.]|nr:class I SAM-dependent methyltransferase [Niabella sp.]
MILEFSQPKSGVFSPLYKFYMKLVAPQFAKMFTQDSEAYQYLNESAKAFPERDNLVNILKKVGFKNANYKALSFGICCIYRAEK